MFRLPNLPSSQAECHELADFAELLAWDKGSISAREIEAYLGRLGENDHNAGCDDNDDENADEIDEVMNELERRAALAAPDIHSCLSCKEPCCVMLQMRQIIEPIFIITYS